MARVQADSGLSPQRVSPRANPVSTYAPPERTGLQRLAQSLADFEPTLARFSAMTLERSKRENLAAGQAEGDAVIQKMREEKLSYDEAVKQGIIRKDQNPWFRLGMQQQFGEVAANDYGLALREEAERWLEAGEDDPSKFASLEAKFRTQWVKENFGDERTPAFNNVFADQVNNIAYGVGVNFAQRAGDVAVQKSQNAVYEQALGRIRALEDPEADLGAIQGSLRELQQAMIQEQTLDPQQVNQKIVDAIADYAVETRDSNVLELLDPESGLRAGTGPLGNTEYANKTREQALSNIRASIDADANFEARQRARMVQENYREFVDTVLEDPSRLTQEFANEWARRVEVDSPEVATAIRNFPRRLAREEVPGDPTLLNDLGKRIINEQMTIPDVLREIDNSDLSFPESLQLLNAAQTVAAYSAATSGAGGDPLRDPYWGSKTGWLRSVSGADSELFGYDAVARRTAVVRYDDAQQDARRLMMSWLIDNPDSSQWERQRQMDQIFEDVRTVYFPLGEDPMADTTDPQQAREIDQLTNRERQQIAAFQAGTIRSDQITPRVLAKLRVMGYDLTSGEDWDRIFDDILNPNN